MRSYSCFQIINLLHDSIVTPEEGGKGSFIAPTQIISQAMTILMEQGAKKVASPGGPTNEVPVLVGHTHCLGKGHH
jgi:hypothetical protein